MHKKLLLPVITFIKGCTMVYTKRVNCCTWTILLYDYQNFLDGHIKILVTSFFLARGWHFTHANWWNSTTLACQLCRCFKAAGMRSHLFKFFFKQSLHKKCYNRAKVLQNVRNKLCHNSYSGTKLTAAPGRMGVAPGSDVIT